MAAMAPDVHVAPHADMPPEMHAVPHTGIAPETHAMQHAAIASQGVALKPSIKKKKKKRRHHDDEGGRGDGDKHRSKSGTKKKSKNQRWPHRLFRSKPPDLLPSLTCTRHNLFSRKHSFQIRRLMKGEIIQLKLCGVLVLCMYVVWRTIDRMLSGCTVGWVMSVCTVSVQYSTVRWVSALQDDCWAFALYCRSTVLYGTLSVCTAGWVLSICTVPVLYSMVRGVSWPHCTMHPCCYGFQWQWSGISGQMPKRQCTLSPIAQRTSTLTRSTWKWESGK